MKNCSIKLLKKKTTHPNRFKKNSIGQFVLSVYKCRFVDKNKRIIMCIQNKNITNINI